MNRIVGLGIGCGLATAALISGSSVVQAQTRPLVTITFHLTINGTVPPTDSFVVSWAQNGIEMCAAPCKGGGRTYTATTTWSKGTDVIHLVFLRFRSPQASAFPDQRFGQQTVTAAADSSVRGFFTYGTAVATVAPPSTGGAPAGGAPPFVPAAVLVLAGSALVLLPFRRRYRRRFAALGRSTRG